MEVHVDDMMIKLTNVEDHSAHFERVFNKVRKHNMCLNLENCFFGVNSGKFLNFMITQWEIENNHNKCKTILTMRSLSNLKEVQSLHGKLVALTRFLPKLAEKAKPFFGLLKGKKGSNGMLKVKICFRV